MYNAKIITEDGNTVSFGYQYGILFDISPLSGADVDVNTSQGFQQIGTTVESLGVGGISRTIKGTFINKSLDEAKSMLANLPVFARGTLWFNDEYYCNIVIQKTPTIAKKNKKTTFTMMVYCNTPFWYDTNRNAYSMGIWQKRFRFPTAFDSHIFAERDASAFVDCYNYGSVRTAPTITFTASSTVTNFGLINANTLEYLRINTSLEAGETVTVYRKNSRLYIERDNGNATEDIFEYLDEYSDLYWLYPGSNILRMTADQNEAGLQCVVSFENAYMGVIDVS